MSTDDYLPPHEVRGGIAQLGDAGGGVVPLIERPPVPFALANGSPGLATNAATTPLAPTLPSDDPANMARLLSVMATEMFFGAPPIAPAPAPAQAPSALASPPTAGAAPAATPPTGVPAASPPAPAAPAAPAAHDVPGVTSLSLAPPAIAPPVGGPPSPPTSVPTSSFAGVPGVPATPTVPSPAVPGAPSLTSVPVAPPTPSSAAAPASPFSSAPSFDAVLGAAPFGFEAEYAVPLFDAPARPERPAIDAPPAYALPEASPPEVSPVAPTSALIVPTSAPTRAPASAPTSRPFFDPYVVRKDFPILDERVHGKRLVWLDNAATTHKPKAVIDRLSYFYEHENSNIHRAAHSLAARASDAYEQARETVRRFVNASSAGEIVFVRGATEGINLIAQAWGRRHVQAGDEIIITHLEHHANIVPWQMLCHETGAKLKVAPVDDRGDVILEGYERLFSSRTKLVSITQVSNALGTVTPAREMVAIARRYGATVVVDGAQAVSHMPVDVQALDSDFYVFSGHKVFAPTGIGAVHAKRSVLEALGPWQGGGNMIADVTFERTVYQPPPNRMEAGTGNIADAVGMGAALDYVMKIGMDVISRYEHELLVYGTEALATVPGLHMIGTAREKAGVLSFILDGQHTQDVGAALDKDGIAVRSGHHCAQPILRRFGVEATVRASLAFYNVVEDIDALVASLQRLQAGRRA